MVSKVPYTYLRSVNSLNWIGEREKCSGSFRKEKSLPVRSTKKDEIHRTSPWTGCFASRPPPNIR